MNFKNWLLSEMPLISLQGKKAFADEEELKNTDVERVSNNIVMFRQPESNEMSFIAPGATWVYFMDSEESAQQMKSGQIPMLMVPKGTFMSGGSPITDIWKKKFQKPGTEHILGVIEGSTNKDEIFIDMMSVRAGYRRNTINSKMIQYLKKVFPEAKISYSHPTDSGKKFISGFKESTEVPDAEYLGELFNNATDWYNFVHYLRVQLKDNPTMRFEIVAPWASLEKTRSAKALIDMYRRRLNIDRFAIVATREQYNQDVNLFQSGLEWIEKS